MKCAFTIILTYIKVKYDNILIKVSAHYMVNKSNSNFAFSMAA